MKRRMISLAVLFLLVFSLSAQTALAAEARVTRVWPTLCFDGTTAVCSVSYRAGSTSDKISATLTLYQGDSYVDSWSDKGTGSIRISGECEAQSGKDYRLVLTYSINGTAQTSASVEGTCP